jgi:hypothetical protein
MRNKIPPDAFDYYRSLGAERTYSAVARQYGVSLRGVTKRAVNEDWQGRLQRIETEARRKRDDQAIEDVAAVDERHLKLSRAIQARALVALRTMPLHSGMSAVRALDVAIKIERAILGRGKDVDGPARAGHASLAEAAGLVPSEVVQAMLAAGRAAMEARDAGTSPRTPAPTAAPPMAPIAVPIAQLAVSQSLAWPGAN